MSFIARLQRARAILEQQGRLSTRALERELEIGGDELDELIEELVDVQQVARREGKILVWAGASAARPSDVTSARATRTSAPPHRPGDQAEARKVVTIIFADLIGSTSLHERLDAESVTHLMERYYRAMRGAVEAHGGTVVKLMGDGVMAAFGVPRVTEDDAIRAVRAGVAMQDAFRALARNELAAVGAIGLRVGINTGEVVVSADNTDVVGDPVNVAARLQTEAHDGDVVIGESTRRLVAALVTLAPLGSFALKGRAEAMKAYRVVSLERPAAATSGAFVGRDEELARITAVYEAARATPAGRLAVLLGSPGLGKSRLIAEVTRRLGDAASVVTAHCDAAGGATFAPVAAALREFFRVEAGASTESVQALIEAAIPGADAERTRIAGGIAALLAGSPASPEETFFVIRRLLAGLAAATPVVLVIDDLQWAEPLLLDLVEHLVQWGSGVPLLVLVGARPELRDLRSSLVTPGGLVADVVTLAGLDAGAAMRLAANVIGAADLPAAVAAKVLATSEGNPLFVGELVRMLVDEGAIERQGERWIVGANLASLEMPPTIHALLAARIERLRPEERSVLECAAVVGRHFSRSAVAALLGRNGTELDARLEALRRTELIERDTGWFLGEPVLRFHHVLVRDAAYRRLLKGTRAELHEHLADWIEAQVKDAPEHDEMIGWHLEQAHQHRRELGPLDAKGKTLGERAAKRLAAAGRRALERDDVPLAASLLGRAIERLDSDDSSRADLALDWCEALLSAGDVVPAAKAIDELGRLIGGSGAVSRDRLRAWHTCFAGQLTVMTAPQELQATADAVAAAGEALATLGDAAGEAKAHSVHAQALARLGKVGACEAALDKALAAARKAGDRRRANAVLAGAPLAALWGPSPVTRASGRCLDVVRVLRITLGAPAVEAVALNCQGVLEALRGRTDAARRMIASSRTMVEELGIAHRLFEANVFAGRIDLLEGDAVAAERNLRGAYEGLRELGLGIDAACAGALLARSVLAQDRAGEAETLSHQSEALAGDDLQAAIAWRGVRAEALARRGEHALAVELAQAAVAIAATTDALLDHADARVALAAALRSAGRAAEADAEERRAIELWEAKGATLLAERARQKTGGAAPVVPEFAARAAPARRVQRRIRANAASAVQARLEAAFPSHDLAAIDALLGDPMENVDHPTGSTYGREAQLDSCKRMLRMPDLSVRVEPLGTLGESLCLCRRLVAARGTTGGHFDVAEYEMEHVGINELDEVGRLGRLELFAPDHLGAAIGRFYQRYAEILPDGLERIRAAATARSVAAMTGFLDRDRMASAIASGIEVIDHRILGTWAARGADALLNHFDAWLEVGDAHRARENDILGLQSNALLMKRTFSGTDREGGGAFDGELIVLWVFGSDGLLSRCEFFDPDREAEALARFDALVGGIQPTPLETPPTEVFANAASRAMREFERGWRAQDWDRVRATYHPSHRMDDRRRLMRLVVAGDEFFANERMLFDDTASEWHGELLATRGERLALFRVRFAATVGGSGLMEVEMLDLVEVDTIGRRTALVVFDLEDQDSAYAELDARFEAGEGAAHPPFISSYARAIASRDWDAIAALYPPSFLEHDHRAVAVLGTTRGPEAWMQDRALLELAPDTVVRFDHVRHARRGFLSQVTWQGSRDGARYESPFVIVTELDEHGTPTRNDLYDPEQLDQAKARFDALVLSRVEGLAGGTDAVSAAMHFENAASRSLERNARCWAGHDWEGALAILSPALRFDDRRRLMRLEIGYEDFVAQFRMLFDQPGSRWQEALLTTRGERLSLTRTRFEAEVAGGGGPLAIDDHLSVTEVDADGRWIVAVTFDLEDLDAAYGELDARWAAGEATEHGVVPAAFRAMSDAIARRDWDALAACCAPRFSLSDHRLLGWGSTLHDAAMFVRSQQALAELSPDVRYRLDHLRTSDRAHLCQAAQVGTREGGAFEMPFVYVGAWDESGRVRRIDTYDVDALGQALARFAELAAPVAVPQRFANAATATVEPVIACMVAHDWQGFEQLFAEDFRCSDRRRLVQLELDRDQYVAFTRQVSDGRTIRSHSEVIATRGDRLALTRHTFEFTGGDVGPSEIAFLILTQVDERGRIVAYVRWDLEDLDAAYAELDARWETGEDAAHVPAVAWRRDLRAALERRDWDAVAACYAPAFVGDDHRLASWGTLYGPAAFLEVFRAMLDLAPDARLRWNHLRTSHRGMIDESVWVGTRDGGAFESRFISVLELDAHGKALRFDFYDLHHLDRAQARFEEISAGHARDPLAALAKSNAATTTFERLLAAFEAGDFDSARALFAPRFTWEDRRPLFRLSGDLELMLASAQERLATGARPESHSIVGTAGDRVAVARVLWAGGPPDGRFEVEFFSVYEVDEVGLCTAMIFFDPDDARAAQREAWARWAAIDPAAAVMRLLGEQGDAFNAHDWIKYRAVFTDDLIVEDHRHTGMGRIDGADAYVASVVALWELAPESRVHATWQWPACDRHGAITVVRRTGAVPDGGGEFESEYLHLCTVANGHVTRVELFELDDLDAALARFAELRPDPLRIPPNAATRAIARHMQAFAERDWDGFRSLVSEDFRYADRGRRALLSGDVEMWIGSSQDNAAPPEFQARTELIGTAGDRIALEDMVWMGGPGGNAYETPRIRLFDVGADGRIRALILFDPEDRRAAFAEAQARFVAGEAAAVGGQAPIAAVLHALGRHDWEALRESLAPDASICDRRALAIMGELNRDQWIDSLRTLVDLAPDMDWELFRILAWNRHGRVGMGRLFGSTRNAGPFENAVVAVFLTHGDHVQCYEFFDIEDADRAVARFEELCAAKITT